MNILTLERITKSFQNRKLLEEASFYLQEQEKVGVIGINGTGKSTLLKMIAGLEEPDEGSVIRANHVVVRYLPQSPVFADDMTVLEAVLLHNVTRENEWNVEADAKAMLTRLGVTDFTQPCGQLSGGQKKRLALVSVLLAPADILVLDEPTNHLDAAMSDWLEGQLKAYRGSIVMVTHDRYFLDSVASRIIEIDKGQIYSYDANYAGFLQLKAEREDMLQASERKRQSILRVELEWVKRGARARSTKQKARLERYEELKNTEAPKTDGQVELGSVSSRLGRSTIELNHISKAYDDTVLIQDFSYIFLKNDRIGFLGPNGAGKSTLLKMIMGQVEPDAGTIDIGPTVKIGYYAQEIHDEEMRPDQRVIDYIRDVAEYVQTEDGVVSAAKMLENFLFNGELQYSRLEKLSGGERRRLYLCKVLMGAPNVLILDEPTNDLDITTLQILEDYLDHFQGIVIVVSHDRYFMDRVVRRIFSFEEGGRLRQHEGGYTDYALRMEQEGAFPADGKGVRGVAGKASEAGGKAISGASGVGTEAGGKGKASISSGNASGPDSGKKWNADRVRKLKFTYQEAKDYETIEGDIAALEAQIEKLEQDMLASATDFVKLRELTADKEQAEQQLEEKMDRWMYLEDLAQRIAEQ